MDIVQYLHGLVSPNLGDDVQADLLKQYYALSVCYIAQMGIDVSAPTDLVGLWGQKAVALVKRLSRSFHVSPNDVHTQLNHATPMMMTELSGLLNGQAWSQVLGSGVSALYLPAWAGEFIGGQFVHTHDDPVHTNVHNAHEQTDDEQSLDSTDEISEMDDHELSAHAQNHHTVSARPKKLSPIALGISALAVLALAGLSFGAWHLFKSLKSDDPQTPATAQTTPNSSLNPPRLILTTGENGTLYGCLAEVGNNALQAQFVQILQKNFGQVECIVDVDDSFGSSLVGLERLESIIAMMKSEAFTSIEIIGGQIMVNHPETDVLNRMVGDISLLAPQFSVIAVPPLDRAVAINNSIANATNALNALTDTATPYQLARAINRQHLDFYGTTELPAEFHAPLTLLAQKMSKNPNIKFIIASHTDGTNPNVLANVALSESQAQAVKNFLVQAGVSESQLVTKGVGNAFAISDNITEMGKFQNRRVEFLVFDEMMMSMLTDKINKASTPSAPTAYERPEMVESAPYVPSGNITAEMPVNGMPPVIPPEPVHEVPPPQVSQPAPAPVEIPPSEMNPQPVPEPMPEPMPPQNPNQGNDTDIPQELRELSETTIGSDGVLRGPSYEIRK